jgi:hypothetical protein
MGKPRGRCNASGAQDLLRTHAFGVRRGHRASTRARLSRQRWAQPPVSIGTWIPAEGSGLYQGGVPVTAYTGVVLGPGTLAPARWGRNKLSAAMNARIFDSTFSAKGTGAEGYPNEEQRREEQHPVQSWIWRNRGISAGHYDKVKRKLKDHRCSHSADDGAHQRNPPAVRTAANENDHEDDDHAYGGHRRDRVRWCGVKQVLTARVVNVYKKARQKRHNSNAPSYKHVRPDGLPRQCWPGGERQSGTCIHRAYGSGHQEKGENYSRGAAIADPCTVLSHAHGGTRLR